ncbi:MAG: hypothetical protein Q7R65_03660 [bacterium]|nr:hypothetical protein [bacterium]
MNQKGFANIILVVVIVVILVGAVGYFAFVKKSEPVAQSKVNIQVSQLAPSDSGVVDLLVILVSKSDYCYQKKAISTPTGESGIPAVENAVPAKPGDVPQNEPCPPENRRPSDSVTVRVEKIVSYNRNPNARYEALQEGNTYSSNFISRPAKFKYITVSRMPTGQGPEQITQNLPGSGFQGIENGLYVYGFYSDGSLTKEHEVVMPGFKEGDKIRAKINFGGNLSITEYELLK